MTQTPPNQEPDEQPGNSTPSWYPSSQEPSPTEQPAPADSTDSGTHQNPYATQPLSGPYGDGQPQTPTAGGYPVTSGNPYTQTNYGQTGYEQSGYNQQSSYNYPASTDQSYNPGAYGEGGWAPAEPAPKRGLSITSMVLGIVNIVMAFALLVIPAIVGVVLGHMGLRREPAGRGFAVAGLVMNYLSILGGVIFWGFIIFVFVLALNEPYVYNTY